MGWNGLETVYYNQLIFLRLSDSLRNVHSCWYYSSPRADIRSTAKGNGLGSPSCVGVQCWGPAATHPLTLLPQSAPTKMMYTDTKHMQVAESNVSTANCTANKHCNRVFCRILENGAGRNFKRLLTPSLPHSKLLQHLNIPHVSILWRSWAKMFHSWSQSKTRPDLNLVIQLVLSSSCLISSADTYTEHQTGWPVPKQ